MTEFLKELSKKKILLFDGGFGTMLINNGLKIGDCPEELIYKNPALLESITKAYFDAGANILQTNTFGASSLKLTDYELQNKIEEINSLAVKLTKSVCNNKAFVSGIIGPSGKLLQPSGLISYDEMFGNYFKQAEVLINSGVDLITIETMTDIDEALIALKCVKKICRKIPVIVSISFDKTHKGFYTIMGNDIKSVVNRLIDNDADIIGSNCGFGTELMIEVAEEIRNITNFPLCIQPNAGMPELINGKLNYPETPEFMAEKIKKLIDLNINIIGGCCGTTPDYIKKFRYVIDNYIK